MSSLAQLARTPAPPYYAVIFTSRRTAGDAGYGAMSEKMVDLGSRYDGFLGIESARGADGVGIFAGEEELACVVEVVRAGGQGEPASQQHEEKNGHALSDGAAGAALQDLAGGRHELGDVGRIGCDA